MTRSTDTARFLRRGFALLAALGLVGTALELAMLRHWKTNIQLIPWLSCATLLVALVLLVVRPGARSITTVRALAVVIALSGLLGVVEHVYGNYQAGPLNARYTDRWATMSSTARWWAAITKAVGASPAVAPAVLIQAALCLLFATTGHPAARRGAPSSTSDELLVDDRASSVPIA